MTHSDTENTLRERVLSVMDRKNHWAWPYFSGSLVTKDHLKTHYRQEYEVYVRDFPVLLARIYANHPPEEVRSLLAENIYEEDTGRLSLGHSHAALFLKMMRGLGFDPEEFRQVELLPASRTYREWLEDVSLRRSWLVGAAALTVLVEGSINDRQELRRAPTPRTPEEIEDGIRKHPLVQFHGVSPDSLDLFRAHQMVEAGHRHAAYQIVETHAFRLDQQDAVVRCLQEGLQLWLKYRDGVADACGITPP